ncbi:hypothetical protein PanWU01x14_362080 [Parasponia andersonii]|uniref:Uncharacterized protein n=1 Tax=Parasponia andersonii TaxID=3476 RepID=A0A2P5A752_PARAD|nr:hypothetical protein PanWU01x14_362080 [Parasponia andersonii]
MCNLCYEIVDLAAGDENKCNFVIEMIHDLKEKLVSNNDVCGSKNKTQNSEFGDEISKEGYQIHSPSAVRNKGHPPFNRKQSKVEQIIRRRKRKKIQLESNGQQAKKANRKKKGEEIANTGQFTHEYSADYIATLKDNLVESLQIPQVACGNRFIDGVCGYPLQAHGQDSGPNNATHVEPSSAKYFHAQCTPSGHFS